MLRDFFQRMNDEEDIFRDAVKGVKPLKIKSPKIQKTVNKPKPIAKKFLEDEKKALLDTLSDDFITSENESGEELRYLKKGHSPDILNKLKKGYWVTQKSIDLHGLISEEAKAYIVNFIGECKKKKIRCIKIIHGKGLRSFNKEPVLRNKVKNWLAQKDEVIAYIEAPRHDGGSGAVLVLLREY
ncbi:Smr/MutS family protein [Methylophilaceae bacterium]|nr:Smr/MutS family protein [Methylophilaceae bacterium]